MAWKIGDQTLQYFYTRKKSAIALNIIMMHLFVFKKMPSKPNLLKDLKTILEIFDALEVKFWLFKTLVVGETPEINPIANNSTGNVCGICEICS